MFRATDDIWKLKEKLEKEPCVVVMVGSSGGGKSTLARFLAEDETHIASSDHLRRVLCGDASNMSVTGQAFYLQHKIITARAEHNQTVFVDSTNLKLGNRRTLLKKVREANPDIKILAILVDTDEETCKARQSLRERKVPEFVIEKHAARYQTTRGQILDEDFDEVMIVDTETGVVEDYATKE